MPRKTTKQIVEEVIQEESEQPSEVEEEVQVQKPKRVLTEAQLANLQRAREAAAQKKKEMKETKDKAKNKEKLELEIKAMEYDQLLKKKQELVVEPETPVIKPTKSKKLVKKIYEEESDDEEEVVEEVIVKKLKPKKVEKPQPQKQNYNQMLYQSATHTIQEKLLDERAKSLMQKLMPSY
jgi:hypothetical protein